MRTFRLALEGALAGSAATLVMSAFMLLAQRHGAMSKLPPREITEAAVDAAGAGARTDERTLDLLTAAAHIGFGAVAGSLFAVLRDALRLPLHAAVQGVAFATGVWTVSYMGWVPALGIMPPAHRDERGRPEAMVVAHWIYGAVLGFILESRHANNRKWS